MTADSKTLIRVCIVDFITAKVVCDQFVEPLTPIPTTSPGTFALTCAQSKLFWDNNRSVRPSSPYTDNAFDNLPGSFARIGSTYHEAFARMLDRPCTVITGCI